MIETAGALSMVNEFIVLKHAVLRRNPVRK
jgi:hypothetical protein